MSPPPTPPGGSTDTSLLRRVRAKEHAAWCRLIEWAGPLVYFWCRRAGLRAEDREEVFQEVFAAVASSIDNFRRDRAGDTFRGWLLTITRNKVIDLARKQLNQPQAQGGSDAYRRLLAVTDEQLSGPEPGAPNAKRVQLARVLDVIRGDFEETTWKAFWRTAVEGAPAPEVAAELGLSPQAVRKAKSRVLARLRQEFGELLG